VRFLMKVTIPVDVGNELVRGPDMAGKINEIMEFVRPEAAYFAVGDGQRSMFLIVNADEASELPRLVEPFWLAFEADIEVTPVMSQADFEKAATHIAEAARKF